MTLSELVQWVAANAYKSYHTGLQVDKGIDAAMYAPQYAQQASESATAAAVSASDAAESAEAAAASAAAAATSETNAAASETGAAGSASAAASSQTAAAGSASNAAASATAAAGSATSALTSATEAQTAKTAAESAKSAAETAQSNAAASATAAAGSALSAAASASTAQQYSGNPAIVQSGYWWIWNATAGQYENSGHRATLAIDHTYTSVETMNADFANTAENDLATISGDVENPDTAKLYIHPVGGTEWQYLTDLSGVQGPKGDSAFATDENSGRLIRAWYGTVAEYNALAQIDPDVYYYLLEGSA